MRTLFFLGVSCGLVGAGCGSDGDGASDANASSGDARLVTLDAGLPTDSGPWADGDVAGAMASDERPPDAGRWPVESFCPPLDCTEFPSWEGPEGLDCPPPADAPACPVDPLVCPDDLSQLRPDAGGVVEFTKCGSGVHGPECEGQPTCESCVDPETGERWEGPTDTRCEFDEHGRVVDLLTNIGSRTRVEYDVAGRVVSFDGSWAGTHRDWSFAGQCRYDTLGRCIWFKRVEDEGAGGEGFVSEGACVRYNRAGQRTASAHFFEDDPNAFNSTRCVAVPATTCRTVLDCERRGSPETDGICSGRY